MTQSVHPPKSWALNFWKINFVYISFFCRAEDFLSQGNTSLRISTKFHFSIWLHKIYLNEFHIIKRNLKITPNTVMVAKRERHQWIIFQNDANRPTLHLWALHHIISLKWLQILIVIERNMANAFECFQHLIFCIFFKFDVPLRNKNMALY